jgi:acyl-CoA synthetase (AMP-forming)/AMP-acid ligase II
MAVLDSIFAHARETPDKTAVFHNGHGLSYRRFAALILLARRHLEERGVSRERLAVLCIRSLIDGWIIGLALRSLGVTTAFVGSMDTVARLSREPITVLCTPTEAELWPGLADAASRADWPLFSLAAEVFEPWRTVGLDVGKAGAGAAPAPGAHILLTSGTTGVYKKVRMDAAAEALDAPSRAALFGFTADSVVNVFDFGLWTSVGHNMAVCVWGLGATVGLQQGPDRFRHGLTPGVTHAMTTPHMLESLARASAPPAARNHNLILFVGAGVLSPDQWRAAREILTVDVRTWIGATETGAICATAVHTLADLTWHHIDQAREVQVVDEDDRPVPAGQVGLVRVRPLGVRGYLDDPEATAAFFRNGYFYPGDLGVLREDGRLALQGRVTDIINVLGDKLAALPIESRLRDRLGARAVCVFSAAGEQGEEVHVMIQPGRPVGADDLKDALEASLPPHAGTRVHIVSDFPRNHMGKIERAELKRRVLAAPATDLAPGSVPSNGVRP